MVVDVFWRWTKGAGIFQCCDGTTLMRSFRRIERFPFAYQACLTRVSSLFKDGCRDGELLAHTTWLIPLKSPRQLSFFVNFPCGCQPPLATPFTLSMMILVIDYWSRAESATGRFEVLACDCHRNRQATRPGGRVDRRVDLPFELVA